VGGRQRRIDLAEIVVIRSVLVACFPIAYPPSGLICATKKYYKHFGATTNTKIGENLTARGMAHYVHIALGEAIDPIFLGRVRVGAWEEGEGGGGEGGEAVNNTTNKE